MSDRKEKTLDKDVLAVLRVTFGFSSFNARVALDMYYDDELEEAESRMIYRIFVNPRASHRTMVYADTGQVVSDHLNYRISQMYAGSCEKR